MATYDRDNTEVFTTETSWTVPDYVNEVAIECWGEDGEDGSHESPDTNYTYETAAGGARGKAEGLLAVTPGDTLYIRIDQGGIGRNTSLDNGHAYSGKGGDAISVRKNGTSLSSVVIGAGGGGGGGAGYIIYDGSNSADMDASYGGGAGESNENVDFPPSSDYDGEGSLSDAEPGTSDSTPDGAFGSKNTHGTDNSAANASGGGGAGYDGSETGAEEAQDYNGTTYSIAPGGAGGENDISGVTNALADAAPNASETLKVKIHWSEKERQVKVSDAGSFVQRTIYVSDGSTFTQPTNIHRSDGSSWISKYN